MEMKSFEDVMRVGAIHRDRAINHNRTSLLWSRISIFNRFKRNLFGTMIFQSISTFHMNRCIILHTELRQWKPEPETEIEEEANETPCRQ